MVQLDLENTVNFIKDIPFFSEVHENSLTNLCKDLETNVFRKNQVIINKGDQGHEMFVVLSGKVKVHDKDHIYDTLSQGTCFGEYALIDNQERSASVTAVERTELLRIERDHFINLMASDIGFMRGILAEMIKRHRELDTIQEHLATSKKEIELSTYKMSGLINGAMDAIIMFDSNYKIVLTNPSANELLENKDVLQRNILFFFEEQSADLIESIINKGLKHANGRLENYIPEVIKVIGSEGKNSLNEGTISKYGNEEETYYTLILRNIEDRLKAADKIDLLTKQTEYLSAEIKELTNDFGIVANDQKMKDVLNLVKQVANTSATVLVSGETGTGKELVARAIHANSSRNDKPLIRINCGAIPANLIESELFGHRKGAFTGATSDRKGRFLLADKGTLFLDEIGELPINLQPKLLRVIQEGEFDPVGSSETIKVDVRIIAATHRNLRELTKNGIFREDLYYRLNVFPIEIPPLRERGNDICLIADEMLKTISNKLGRPTISLDSQDEQILRSYHWPGNVRELQNLVERAIIISNNEKINWTGVIPREGNDSKDISSASELHVLTAAQLTNLEKENILKALKLTRWKISGPNGAANLLQIPPTTLASKIKALGIERPI